MYGTSIPRLRRYNIHQAGAGHIKEWAEGRDRPFSTPCTLVRKPLCRVGTVDFFTMISRDFTVGIVWTDLNFYAQ